MGFAMLKKNNNEENELANNVGKVCCGMIMLIWATLYQIAQIKIAARSINLNIIDIFNE